MYLFKCVVVGVAVSVTCGCDQWLPTLRGGGKRPTAARAAEQGSSEFVALKQAAERGIARAQYKLGYVYCYGQGVSQDYVEAVKWYRRAAGQGYAEAQCELGLVYTNGEGVPRDYVEALKWYRLAAEQGKASAQFALGHMYKYGHGVPRDSAEAYAWFSVAAIGGNGYAVKDLDLMAVELTPEQLSKAKKLATELHEKCRTRH
ncbi:MAG: tetratricopeptide repeat protein [Rubripirellula sp.]